MSEILELAAVEPKVFFCSRCGRATTFKCGFELRGKKSGSVCGLAVCAHHSARRTGKVLCLAHKDFVFVEKAVEEPVMPKSSGGYILDEVKHFVWTLLDQPDRRSKDFIGGMVMVAPVMRSVDFSSESIVKALGWRDRVIAPYIDNLKRNGIWLNDGTWRCEWMAFLCEENLSNERFAELQMSFILDVMVATGELTRTSEGAKFLYSQMEAK